MKIFTGILQLLSGRASVGLEPSGTGEPTGDGHSEELRGRGTHILIADLQG